LYLETSLIPEFSFFLFSLATAAYPPPPLSIFLPQPHEVTT
jgi:hypothetical protein